MQDNNAGLVFEEVEQLVVDGVQRRPMGDADVVFDAPDGSVSCQAVKGVDETIEPVCILYYQRHVEPSVGDEDTNEGLSDERLRRVQLEV